jgi:hypothetical protein
MLTTSFHEQKAVQTLGRISGEPVIVVIHVERLPTGTKVAAEVRQGYLRDSFLDDQR